MKCPSLEQIYDMDLDNLLSLKENILQNKINFNIIPLNEDDYDLYYENSPNDKDSIINLINSEIKERESTKELLNFFNDLNYDNNIEKKFLAELNSKNIQNKQEILSKNISDINDEENQVENKNILTQNKIIHNPNKLAVHEDMRTFLNRTKIDPNKLQYKVSSNKYIEKYWSIDKEKKLRKKTSDLSDTNMTSISNKTNINNKADMRIRNIKGNRSRIFSEKIVIGAINIKKEKVKKKKKKKIKNEEKEGKKINNLELRRNYKVSDVRQFLKKKTSLKPLNVSNNQNINFNINKNCFNNEFNSHNIKIFNKKSINTNNEHEINEDRKISENKEINNNINKPIKKSQEIEIKNNFIVGNFYFSIEDGCFNEIKYILNDNKLNNKYKATKIDKKNSNIGKYNNKEIINNISFFIKGKCNKEKENLILNKIKMKENNFDFTEQNIKNSHDDKIEKYIDLNYNNNIQKLEQIIVKENEQKNKNDIDDTSNINIIKESEKNENNENKKIIEQCIENGEEEEEEEEMEQNDITNDNKHDFNKEIILNKNDVQKIVQEVQINKENLYEYSLNPIRQRKLNLNKNKSKESFTNFYSLNNNTNTTTFNHQSKNLFSPTQTVLSTNSSNSKEFKKYVLSSVKPPMIKSHYNYIFNKNKQRPKSSLTKNSLPSSTHDINVNSEIKEVVDYSEIYSSFAELFSGYYLTNNYSDQNHFNLINAVKELYESFNKLYYYELNQDLIRQKDDMYNDIVRAEAGVIINRIKHAQEKLLKEEDINTNVEKYCLLKKCLELERKNYGRETNIDDDINNKSRYKKFFRVVLSRPEIYDIVCYTLYKDDQWSELPHGLSLGQCWNLYWSYCPPNIDFTNLFSFQKVNHLINNRIVHRKDLLHKHIMRVRRLNKRCNEFFDIMPLTFLLSKEYVNFVEEFHKYKEIDDYNIWIVKPVGKSRGKGIFLIDNISDVPLNDTFLVQKYLTNPLLLDEGYKFDMRIYCLVTSVNPLEMFLYKDGFARVSNELYTMDITNMKVHLTNAAIQNRNAKKSKNYEKIYGGSKISLDMLRTKLSRQYNIDFDYLIWPQVKDIIIKVFACCQNDIPYCPSTFEMFGFDVIIDTNFRCWLLEINSSPSLERSNVLDDEIKLPLVKDIIKIIDPVDIDKLALINVLERYMKIKNNSKNKDVYLYSPKIQLNMDLNNIFMGKLPRKYGEVPKDMGRFEMICPNKETDKIIKMAGGQKFYNNKKEKKK